MLVLFAGQLGDVAHADASSQLSVTLDRYTFYRGEEIRAAVSIGNTGKDSIRDARLSVSIEDYVTVSRQVQELSAGQNGQQMFRLPTGGLKAAEYVLKATLLNNQGILATASKNVWIGRRLNPDELMVWLWPHQAFNDAVAKFDAEGRRRLDWWFDKGLTNFTFAATEDGQRFCEYALYRGMTAGIEPNGGLRQVDPTKIEDEDAKLTPLRHEPNLANPFHPEVARRQDEANRKLMEVMGKYPNVKTAFFNTEIVDNLVCNNNKAGVQLRQDLLGFSEEEFGQPNFVAPGVISDDDRRYLFYKYVFKQGNGLAVANKRTSDMVHRYRPDILTINDPYRETTILDAFPGVDVIGSWTYTNPDPKLMLFVETLRAACRPEGKVPLNTLTLLNYPGELAPTTEWMLMDTGRLTVTSWITLSRAPKMLGYYVSSSCDPFSPRAVDDLSKETKVSDFEVPMETFETLKNLSQKVFKPYGPMISNLEVSPRRIAVLSSAASGSRLYGNTPTLLGHYDNVQIYHMYTVLAMAHLQADVLFDETVERYGLDDYDVLVLPKCSALPKTVYDEILKFQSRGGVVIADQYLGSDIPGVIKLDFDFTYRVRVNANAIAKSERVLVRGDQLKAENIEVQKLEGVTALEDQRIMESYAARLKEKLAGKVVPEVDCDEPTVLFNMLEKDGVKYLVVINDKRDYDDRLGKYQAVLGRMVTQRVTVRLNEWDYPNLYAYDMLERKELRAKKIDGAYRFDVELTELGGKIIGLYPNKLGRIAVHAPRKMKAGVDYKISVGLTDQDGNHLPGLLPVRITIVDPKGRANEFSDYYCARNGVLSIDFTPALNDDSGQWTIAAIDLTSGRKADQTFRVDEMGAR